MTRDWYRTTAVITLAFLLLVFYALHNDANAVNPPPSPAPAPEGIWTLLVDDLPSGRMVECVAARGTTTQGGVAVGITCDWRNAVHVPQSAQQ